MQLQKMHVLSTLILFLLSLNSYGQLYEISGSPYATVDAPLPERIHAGHEKIILVDPNAHAWGAYKANGKLLRWGIATAGANWCSDIKRECYTKSGVYRIYFLGDGSCTSSKYPYPNGGAAMPYCMYFNGDQALHGSHEVDFGNVSHGCVRIHISDAEWLRYHFVEGPNVANNFAGTKIIIRSY